MFQCRRMGRGNEAMIRMVLTLTLPVSLFAETQSFGQAISAGVVENRKRNGDGDTRREIRAFVRAVIETCRWLTSGTALPTVRVPVGSILSALTSLTYKGRPPLDLQLSHICMSHLRDQAIKNHQSLT